MYKKKYIQYKYEYNLILRQERLKFQFLFFFFFIIFILNNSILQSSFSSYLYQQYFQTLAAARTSPKKRTKRRLILFFSFFVSVKRCFTFVSLLYTRQTYYLISPFSARHTRIQSYNETPRVTDTSPKAASSSST